MNWLTSLSKCVGINITIKDKSAQLLLAGAIFILAMGIAWSFIKGISSITVKSDMKKSHTEKKVIEENTVEPDGVKK